MPSTCGGPARAAIRDQRLEHELTLVESSIALVAEGGAHRVTVSGLQFGELILATARSSATLHGVVASPLWRQLDGGCDISVGPRD